MLLILQCHRLGPLQLFVGLIGHHPAVHHPADHGDQQQDLEDPPLPAGAHPVPHVGAATLPAVGASKPRLRRWKLPDTTFFFTLLPPALRAFPDPKLRANGFFRVHF